MTRALVTYLSWFRSEGKDAIAKIRKLRVLLACRFTKKFIASLESQGLGGKKEIQEELEEELDWIRWLRKTHSELIRMIQSGMRRKK